MTPENLADFFTRVRPGTKESNKKAETRKPSVFSHGCSAKHIKGAKPSFSHRKPGTPVPPGEPVQKPSFAPKDHRDRARPHRRKIRKISVPIFKDIVTEKAPDRFYGNPGLRFSGRVHGICRTASEEIRDTRASQSQVFPPIRQVLSQCFSRAGRRRCNGSDSARAT